MRVAHKAYWPLSVILATTLLLTHLLFGYPKASAREWHFPNQRNPLIAIWNASSVAIGSWDEDEVSIRAKVSSSAVKPDDMMVKRDNHRLEVSCPPAKQGRRVFLTLHVPAKSVLDLSSEGSAVRITEPIEPIRADFTLKAFVQINVPTNAELDMKEAPKAVARRQQPLGGFSSKLAARERAPALLS